MREFLTKLVRRNGIHHAEHRGNGRLVRHGTRGIRQHETIGNNRNAVRQRNQSSKNGENPKHRFGGTRNGEQANERENRGRDHRKGQQLDDEGLVRRERLTGKQVLTRRIVMGDHHDRAVAGRGERAGSTMVGDDILAQTTRAQTGDHGATRALEHVDNGGGEGQKQADHAKGPSNAAKHGTDESDDTQDGLGNLGHATRAELLHLGRESVIGKDLRDDVGRLALLFTTRRSDTRVLQ